MFIIIITIIITKIIILIIITIKTIIVIIIIRTCAQFEVEVDTKALLYSRLFASVRRMDICAFISPASLCVADKIFTVIAS